MITPVNNHLLIEPLKYEEFMQTQRETFEEIGIVIDNGQGNTVSMSSTGFISYPKVGDKVFFDSWLAAKYPKNNDEYYWLVKWEDVRAVEKNEEIPE